MKVKINLLFVFTALLSIPSLVFSQTPELDWLISMGTVGRESGNSIVTDTEGNVYTVGYFENTIDFDPGEDTFDLTSVGFFDIFIQKLSPNGQLLWAKRIGSATADEATGITIDASGNLYITGVFAQTVDFDPGEGTYNLTTGTGGPYLQNIFVLKLDADGNFIWAKPMIGDRTSRAYSITTDANGNVLVTGGFSNTVDFDPGEGVANLTAVNGEDIFILKLDSNGNLIWVKQMIGNSIASGLSIATDTNNNIYTTGFFYDTVDFDPGEGTANLTSLGLNDIFIQKLDSNGNLLWVKQMGSEGMNQGNSLTVDLEDNLYITGSFNGAVDFDPDTGTSNFTSAGRSDGFIQKLNPNGNLIWVKQIGGPSEDMGNSVKTDDTGNVYILGNFGGTVDFDPGEDITNLTGDSNDMFILKLQSDGSFVWAKHTYGGRVSWTRAKSIAIDNNDNIYSTGDFEGIINFNPLGSEYVITAKSYWDIFIQKLSPPSLDLIENSLLDKFIVHPNPTKGKFSVEFSTIQTSMDIRLFTLSGQLLMEKQFQNIKNLPLEIQHPDGIYLLELQDGQGRKTTVKLVKN